MNWWKVSFETFQEKSNLSKVEDLVEDSKEEEVHRENLLKKFLESKRFKRKSSAGS